MIEIPKVALLIDKGRAYDRRFYAGIHKYCQLHQSWSFLTKPVTYLSKTGRKKLISDIADWGADGAIMTHTEYIPEIIELGIPYIVINNFKSIVGVPDVHSEAVMIGKMASEYFIDKGYRNFAFCGYKKVPWSEARQWSFTTIIEDAGHEVITYNPAMQQNKIDSLINWLQSLPKPLALMCCNDDRALDVLQACKMGDIQVPEQISVLGVDNDELVCNFTDPPLSSIYMDTERAGYEIAQALRNMMAGKDYPVMITINPKHIEKRLSTDTTAIEDPIVASAINYIQRNPHKIIQVSDVAEAVAVSKRTLQQHFKANHRSVINEIASVRVERISELLISTNLSVSEIASMIGLTGIEHISRCFKKKKGMSPFQYRKRYSLIPYSSKVP
jgi:LacI family transcriptional regulator